MERKISYPEINSCKLLMTGMVDGTLTIFFGFEEGIWGTLPWRWRGLALQENSGVWCNIFVLEMRCNRENVRNWKTQLIFRIRELWPIFTVTDTWGYGFERILKNDRMNKIRKHKETIGTYQSSKNTFIQPTFFYSNI